MGPRIAVLLPGQGSLDPAALRGAHAKYPGVRSILDQIDPVSRELYGRPLSEVLFGPVDVFGLSQLAVYATDLAAHQILLDEGVKPDVLMGHSLGEVAAVVAAGAYTVSQGARIVGLRSQVLEKHGVEGGLVALSTDAARGRRIIELIDDPGLAVAVENHPGQTVISGPAAALDTVRGIAGQLRIGSVPLEARYPFHNPSLRAAAADFAVLIAPIPRLPLTSPVLSPTAARHLEPDDDLVALLSEQFVRPVAFGAGLRRLHEDGHRLFIEAGGRDALTRLVRHALADPGVQALATLSSDASDGLALDATLAALRAATEESDRLRHTGRTLLPDVSEEDFLRFWGSHGEEIRRLAADRFGDARPAIAAPAATPAPAAVVGDGELRRRVQEIYAETLEYPIEVLTDDALLEAELGVDSVKQVEILTRVYQQLGLTAAPAGAAPGQYDTIGKVVATLGAALAGSR
jgi:acyl transferase domain-containing protein